MTRLVNEVAQWVVLALLALLVLGFYRQLGMFLGHGEGPSLESRGGPTVGTPLPHRTLAQVMRQPISFDVSRGRSLVAFVTDDCRACRRLLASLPASLERYRDVNVVLVARSAQPGFIAAMDDAGFSVIEDPSGELWDECRINATPLIVAIDRRGVVLAKNAGSHHRSNSGPSDGSSRMTPSQ